MTVVGVTGKYCAGKNMAAEILRTAGYAEIDVDSLGHEALTVERDRIIDSFGSAVALPDGEVDRKRLGRIVFSNSKELRRLESIVHPTMVAMVRERISGHRAAEPQPRGVVVNAAILFRMKLTELCDLVLYLHAPFWIRYARARERDNASFLQIVRRFGSQRDVSPQFSGRDADIHSVKNDGSPEQLRLKLKSLLPLP